MHCTERRRQFAEVVHELMHVLGFEPDMFGLYRTNDGAPRSERDPATGRGGGVGEGRVAKIARANAQSALSVGLPPVSWPIFALCVCVRVRARVCARLCVRARARGWNTLSGSRDGCAASTL